MTRIVLAWPLAVVGLIGCGKPPEGTKTPGAGDELPDIQDEDADGGAEDSAEPGDDDTADQNDFCDDTVNVSGLPSCVAERLRCNTTFLHTNVGGTNDYDGSEYTAWGCQGVPPVKYTAPERVYSFRHQGGGSNVRFELNSPCGELDLIVIPWSGWEDGGLACPDETTTLAEGECIVRKREGNDGASINPEEATDYFVIVDSPNGERVNYELRTVCGGGGGGGAGGGGDTGGPPGGGSGGGGPGGGGGGSPE